jgi:hypothetical protein
MPAYTAESLIYTLTSDIFPELILTHAKSSPSFARPTRTDYFSYLYSLWLLRKSNL